MLEALCYRCALGGSSLIEYSILIAITIALIIVGVAAAGLWASGLWARLLNILG
jgi:hypothetical protein